MKRICIATAAVLGLAVAVSAGASPVPIPAASGGAVEATAKPADLGSLRVTGERLKLLQMIQIGLNTPLSTDPRARDVVVCQLQRREPSHLKQLVCATNQSWFRREDEWQSAMVLEHSGIAGGMKLNKLTKAMGRRSPTNGFAAFNDWSRIMAELKQLPAPPKNSVVRMMREIKDQ